jgi:hypothetical protein
MADALAVAVERLRARAQTAPPLPEDPGELEALRPATSAPVPDPVAPIPPPAQSQAPIPPPAQPPAAPAGPAPDAPAPAADTPAQVSAEAQLAPAPSVPAKPANKHSQSLIGRIRNRRKQRRAR